ncbi:hypothetical protein GALL_195760 [mine drainage metagenome]|uniref:Uncharacterized protein n=1 Tax=mine drainage metagenome TaxID=410659 RepID=A0A1J5RS21_9ZZZZ
MQRRRSRRNEERRRRLFGIFLKVLVAGGVFGMLIFYAYEVGYRVAKGEVAALKAQLDSATSEVAKAKEQAEGDRAALNEQRKQAEQIKSLYEQTKPSDDMKEIIAAAQARIAEGFDPKRISYLLRTAPLPRQCQALPVRRFLVRTPKAHAQASSATARLEDGIDVSADGIGADNGRESWFDPDLPVRLHLSQSGQRLPDIGGKLPLERSVPLRGNAELHLTITTSVNRGFADVAAEKCELR